MTGKESQNYIKVEVDRSEKHPTTVPHGQGPYRLELFIGLIEVVDGALVVGQLQVQHGRGRQVGRGFGQLAARGLVASALLLQLCLQAAAPHRWVREAAG